MGWHAIEITESRILGGDFHRLCRDFQRRFISAGAPEEMALFVKRGAFDDARTVYVSPAGSALLHDLIESYGGRTCDEPACDDVTLVYGVPGADELLLKNRHLVRDERGNRPARVRNEAQVVTLPSYRRAAAGV